MADYNEQVRRYLGWARNLHPADKRKLVIEPLAEWVASCLATAECNLDADDKPQATRKVHGTVYLKADGTIYDASDPTLRLGMLISEQNITIMRLIELLPDRTMMNDFVEGQIASKHWIDKFA